MLRGRTSPSLQKWNRWLRDLRKKMLFKSLRGVGLGLRSGFTPGCPAHREQQVPPGVPRCGGSCVCSHAPHGDAATGCHPRGWQRTTAGWSWWGFCLRKDLGGAGFASAWLALPVTRGTLDVSRCVYVFGSYNENEIPRVALCHFARQTESIYARCGY